jgi:hypothetical protein
MTGTSDAIAVSDIIKNSPGYIRLKKRPEIWIWINGEILMTLQTWNLFLDKRSGILHFHLPYREATHLDEVCKMNSVGLAPFNFGQWQPFELWLTTSQEQPDIYGDTIIHRSICRPIATPPMPVREEGMELWEIRCDWDTMPPYFVGPKVDNDD